MTRHKEHECEIDEAAFLKAMASLAELKADPEHQRRLVKERREIAEYMATLDCECPFEHCYGREGVQCLGWESKAGFRHDYGCTSFKPWMDDMPISKDGFELRGSERDGTQVVRRKYTYGFRVPLCPACVSELKRRAAAKSAEARRGKRAERDLDIIMLWDMGKSQRFIAKALECSVGTINGALSRMAEMNGKNTKEKAPGL